LSRTHRRSVSRDVLAIRSSLAAIASALGRLAPALQAATRDSGNPSGRGPEGRNLRLSPACRAALKLQGRYIGHLRSLKPRQKARVKALMATKGARAAISLAKKLARAQHIEDRRRP
jgi:hypothetical protein